MALTSLAAVKTEATEDEVAAVAVLGEYLLVVERRVTAADTEASFGAVASCGLEALGSAVGVDSDRRVGREAVLHAASADRARSARS
ncbi:hypothetical protein ON010_g14480 [Phytophthora cinnamomi]|nr:hypothetical protein ON010_g14480 [Phytophthora cinnamomi]